MQKEVVEANIELLLNLFFSICEPSKNQTLALSLKKPDVGQSDLRLSQIKTHKKISDQLWKKQFLPVLIFCRQ